MCINLNAQFLQIRMNNNNAAQHNITIVLPSSVMTVINTLSQNTVLYSMRNPLAQLQ